jgi:hypothetical protein
MGAGQGDIPSPSNWVALFDMLLTALRLQAGHDFTAMGKYGVALQQKETAYADDLGIVRGSLAEMQNSADVVSGFCILTRLILAIDKFRSGALAWGHGSVLDKVTINVHTGGWVPRSFVMDRESTLKYLEGTWDLSLDPGVGLAQARDTLRSACAILDSKRATPECKKVALEVSLFRKVGYYARFIKLTLMPRLQNSGSWRYLVINSLGGYL